MKPNFFIVGAPKCGTTALFAYLSEHPQIFVPRAKEPHYFANDLYRWPFVKTLDEYLKLFEHAGPGQLAIGEASVFYLYSGKALERIREFNPEARVIAMVRNPIDLVHSLHAQMVYSFNEDERDFEVAWRLQEARKQGQLIPAHARAPAMLQYAQVGMLGAQVARLLQVFGENRSKIIVYDEFSRETKRIYEETLQFLGVRNDPRITFPRVNASKVVRSRILQRFTRRPPFRVDKYIERVKARLGFRGTGVVAAIARWNTRSLPRPPLSPRLRRELAATFADDIDRLSTLLGRDFSHWLDVPAAPPAV